MGKISNRPSTTLDPDLGNHSVVFLYGYLCYRLVTVKYLDITSQQAVDTNQLYFKGNQLVINIPDLTWNGKSPSLWLQSLTRTCGDHIRTNLKETLTSNRQARKGQTGFLLLTYGLSFMQSLSENVSQFTECII